MEVCDMFELDQREWILSKNIIPSVQPSCVATAFVATAFGS